MKKPETPSMCCSKFSLSPERGEYIIPSLKAYFAGYLYLSDYSCEVFQATRVLGLPEFARIDASVACC